MNEFRKNPKILIKHLEGLKKHLDRKTKVLSEPGKIQIQMVEGEVVINEAINFLQDLPQLKPFDWDESLSMAALEHVLDIGPKGFLSYQSSDGTEPEERICKYGNYYESLGENIDFGPNDAMGVLVSLTLDDGEPERPHRENLFKQDYYKLGIACGPHKSEYQMCVMDFAYDFEGFHEKENAVDEEENPPINKSIPVQQDKKPNTTSKNEKNPNDNESFDDESPLIKRNKITPQDNHVPEKKPKQQQPNILDDFTNNNLVQTANFSHNINKSQNLYEGTFGGQNPQKINPKETNQSPLIKLSLDNNEYERVKHEEMPQDVGEIQEDILQVINLNSKKRVIEKNVEVTIRTIYTFEDGTTKEMTEKQNHVFNYNN